MMAALELRAMGDAPAAVLPTCPRSELAVVGAVVLYPSWLARLRRRIGADDLAEQGHRMLLDALVNAQGRLGRAPDLGYMPHRLAAEEAARERWAGLFRPIDFGALADAAATVAVEELDAISGHVRVVELTARARRALLDLAEEWPTDPRAIPAKPAEVVL